MHPFCFVREKSRSSANLLTPTPSLFVSRLGLCCICRRADPSKLWFIRQDLAQINTPNVGKTSKLTNSMDRDRRQIYDLIYDVTHADVR